ncbi:MAG: 30S ribosomal protein S5 [Candidatus Omnitrophica bacterium]|nr:30S ribosomal protein S5 [Candidatus Omnitrophota bacterium]
MKDPKKDEELKEKEEEAVAEAVEQPVLLPEPEAVVAQTPAVAAALGQQGGGGRSSRQRRGEQRKAGPKKQGSLSDSGLIEKVVSINRVTKTNKGGKRLSFSALVVVGDGKGKVGYGLGKAGEVAAAIKKGFNAAKKEMIVIARHGTTITHEILGSCGSAKVLLKPASEGTGVIASGAVRAVCDGAGISNILTKCHRSNNPINVVKATFDGLSRLKIQKDINICNRIS